MKNHRSISKWAVLLALLGAAQLFIARGAEDAGSIRRPVDSGQAEFAGMSRWQREADEPAVLLPGVRSDAPAHQVPPTSDPALQIIFFGTDIRERLKYAHALGADLNAAQLEALSGFLRAWPGTNEMNRPGLWLLKNDILNVLQDQSIPPAVLTDTLIRIYHDEVQDNVIRDYAIQHLITSYEQRAVFPAAEKKNIQNVLFEAAQANTSIAGTALLGLHRLSVLDTDFNQGEIKKLALAKALSDQAQSGARITALQVCAERGEPGALPVVKALAANSSNLTLRISAIAALGHLGHAEDITLLEKIGKNQDPVMQPAIRAALTQLRQKAGQKELVQNQNER